MANTKISALTAISASNNAQEIPVNDAGVTKKITLAQALAHSHSHTKAQISDFSHTHPDTDVTGLEEKIQDTVGAMVAVDSTMTATYNDTSGVLTLTAPAGAHTHDAADVTDLAEATQDIVGAMVVAGANITANYSDAAGTLTIAGVVGNGLGWHDVVQDYGAAGDGVADDRSAIEDAIAAADAAGGGVIYFPEGTYMVGYNAGNRAGIYLTGRDDIHFVGAGIGVTIIKQKAHAGAGTDNFHLFNLDNNNARISWRWMTLDGNSSAHTGVNVDASHLIELEDTCTDIWISEVEFNDAIGDGVRLLGTGAGSWTVKRVWIDKCRFINGNRSGVAFQRAVEYVWVTDNYYEGTSDQDISWEPSGSTSPRHIVCSGNIVNHSTAPNSIVIAGVDGSDLATDIKFVNNVIVGGDIKVVRTDGFLIAGNYFESQQTSRFPIWLSGTVRNGVVRDNECRWTAGTAATGHIHVNPDNGVGPSDISIVGNRVVCTQNIGGINVQDASRILIQGNTVKGSGAGSTIGIRCRNASMSEIQDIQIIGNTVLDFSATAIQITGGASNLVRGIQVVGNTFDDTDTSTPSQTTGIDFNTLSTYLTGSPPVVMGNLSNRGITSPIANLGTAAIVVAGGSANAIGTANVSVSVFFCSGTPEGAITAPVGSMATRRDGGAGTTFYIKESGTGNTGWVAK